MGYDIWSNRVSGFISESVGNPSEMLSINASSEERVGRYATNPYIFCLDDCWKIDVDFAGISQNIYPERERQFK